ncbi:hypothetical protein TheetDRAFT_2193 [Thermoanaerobacter ethanolicus JW 200]|nr:hypothetical protein TheetDRAFT_2193 [Thermoanaerobacter ethanolicus JW 200]
MLALIGVESMEINSPEIIPIFFEDIDLILKNRGQIIMREVINKTAKSPIRRKRFRNVEATKMSNDKIIAEII